MPIRWYDELPEDRPYGPGNPDYEYDKHRQREVDGEEEPQSKEDEQLAA